MTASRTLLLLLVLASRVIVPRIASIATRPALAGWWPGVDNRLSQKTARRFFGREAWTYKAASRP